MLSGAAGRTPILRRYQPIRRGHQRASAAAPCRGRPLRRYADRARQRVRGSGAPEWMPIRAQPAAPDICPWRSSTFLRVRFYPTPWSRNGGSGGSMGWWRRRPATRRPATSTSPTRSSARASSTSSWCRAFSRTSSSVGELLARVGGALGSFARAWFLDRRGSGLSDPVASAPSLEERMDDVYAVMDAAGSNRATLIGVSEGVPMSIVFAATYPERVRASSAWAGSPARPTRTTTRSPARRGVSGVGRGVRAAVLGAGNDHRDRRPEPGRQRGGQGVLRQDGARHVEPRDARPARADVPGDRRPRGGEDGAGADALLHRRYDRLVNVRHSRWLAENMPNAKLVELPGMDHALVRERGAGDGGDQEF